MTDIALLVLLYLVAAALTLGLTVVPWVIGIGWMMHHWLGV